MKWKSIAFLALFICGVCSQLDPHWQLNWSDEFTESSISGTWLVWNQPGLGGLEFDTPNNVYIANGSLVIETKQETYNNSGTIFNYTSGHLNTSPGFKQTYGRWEVRAQLPTGAGILAQYRVANTTPCWPVNTDFAMLQNVGLDDTTIYGGLAYGNYCGTADISLQQSFTDIGVNLAQGYHVYAFEWNSSVLVWKIDEMIYQTVANGDQGYHIDATEHYFIAETDVGGGWAGAPNANTTFPQYHYIHYVRVYEWNPNVVQISTGQMTTGVSVTTAHPTTNALMCPANSFPQNGVCVCNIGYSANFAATCVEQGNTGTQHSDASSLVPLAALIVVIQSFIY